MDESAATAGAAAAAAAAAGLGAGVGGRSSPSLSAGSKLRSASIIGLGGGGWVSGIVSVRAPVAGVSELRMRVQGGTGLALDWSNFAKAWTGRAKEHDSSATAFRPGSHHAHQRLPITVLVSAGPFWIRPMSLCTYAGFRLKKN